jgi:hypothetical protein
VPWRHRDLDHQDRRGIIHLIEASRVSPTPEGNC